MRKTAGKIAMVLILVMLAHSFTGCASAVGGAAVYVIGSAVALGGAVVVGVGKGVAGAVETKKADAAAKVRWEKAAEEMIPYDEVDTF